MKIDTVKAMRYGKLTSTAWWKEVRAKSSVAELKKKYDNLIDEYTVNP